MIIASGGHPTEQSQSSPNQPMHIASLRPLDLNTLVCDPTVIVPADLDPKIGVVYLDKFDRDVVLPKVNIISGFGVSVSVVFKVCIYFDMCWEIILLSPMNLFVFVSEFANEYHCHQVVIGVCPMFQGRSR